MNNNQNKEENEIKISGELSKIIFKSDTGFLIGVFTGEEQFTATGTLINPQTGLDYTLHGDWKDTPKYGRQFVFTRVETDLPVDPNGIFKYIVRICKFVGSKVGQRIVDKYGAETLDIMKSDPGRVAKDISGITEARAAEIQTTLLENQHRERVMVELGVILDVPGMIKKTMSMLYQDYKDQAAEAVKKNPYILTKYPMVGFIMADRVAMQMGFSRVGIQRKVAAAMHCMGENASRGNTCMSTPDLIQAMTDLIQVVDLEAGVQALIDQDALILDDGMVSLRGHYVAEMGIARAAIGMLSLSLRED